MTCIKVQKGQVINASFLGSIREEQLNNDQVFSPSFLETVIFVGASEDTTHPQLQGDAKQLLAEWGSKNIEYVQSGNSRIGNGPYYVHDGYLHSVWKLYRDRQLAFLQAVWDSLVDPE